jgi:hypothetical protein
VPVPQTVQKRRFVETTHNRAGKPVNAVQRYKCHSSPGIIIEDESIPSLVSEHGGQRHRGKEGKQEG